MRPLISAGLVIVMTALVLADAPATQPAAGPTTQPGFGQQILPETLGELGKAKSLELVVSVRTDWSPVEAVNNPNHQATVNRIAMSACTLSAERPNRVRIQLAGGEQNCFEQFEGDKVSFIRLPRPGEDRPASGYTGLYEGHTIDEFLRNRGCFSRMVVPELVGITDSECDSRFFRYATDWTWLGAANDNGIATWRFELTDANHARWQIWVSQAAPRRFTRIIIDRPTDIAISEVKPGGDPTSEDWNSFNNSHYNLRERREYVFTTWNTAAAFEPTRFELPAAKLTNREFDDDASTVRVGDMVAIPPLMNVDGTPVDVTKLGNVIALDFWQINNGPSSNGLLKIAEKFATVDGVKFYAIASGSKPDAVAATLAKLKWEKLPVLVDVGRNFARKLDIKNFPTKVILNAQGKVLYIDQSWDELGQLQFVDAATRLAAK